MLCFFQVNEKSFFTRREAHRATEFSTNVSSISHLGLVSFVVGVFLVLFWVGIFFFFLLQDTLQLVKQALEDSFCNMLRGNKIVSQ